MSKYPPPPPGLHRAVISGVKPDLLTKTQAYRMCKVDFSLLTMGCAGSRVSRWYLTAKVAADAKDFPVKQGREQLVKLFEAAKRPTGPTSSLEGAIVTVLVKHQPNDSGDVWATVDTVLPDNQPATPPSVSPEPSFSDDGLPF